MLPCSQSIITNSCATLVHLSTCSTCTIVNTNGNSAVNCNGVPMKCVYGSVGSGSTSNPKQAYYNQSTVSNVLMVVDTTSENAANTLSIIPSVPYVVNQVYTDNTGVAGNWMKSMTISTPSNYLILYENSYATPQEIYTYFGYKPSVRRILVDNSQESCSDLTVYECNTLLELGVCSAKCPQTPCASNVVTTCNKLAIAAGSKDIPAQGSMTFNGITDQITMILEENLNINNSITMMVSGRSLSSVGSYNGSYYKSSFLLNPSDSTLFAENYSPNNVMATIVQTQYVANVCSNGSSNDHLPAVWALIAVCSVLFVCLSIAVAYLWKDRAKQRLISKNAQLSDIA